MSPTPSAGSEVRLTSTGGDVFAWEERLHGIGECSEPVVTVDGSEVDAPVELDGDEFFFRVPVGTGLHHVAVRCTSPDGSTAETEPITLTGMLEVRPTARIDVSVDGSTVVFDAGRACRPNPTARPSTATSGHPIARSAHPSPR